MLALLRSAPELLGCRCLVQDHTDLLVSLLNHLILALVVRIASIPLVPSKALKGC